MIHDLGVYAAGVATGALVALTLGYAWWVTRALERDEP